MLYGHLDHLRLPHTYLRLKQSYLQVFSEQLVQNLQRCRLSLSYSLTRARRNPVLLHLLHFFREYEARWKVHVWILFKF